MSNDHSNIIAVIGFSNLASPLMPLWPTTHRGMLPLGGKPLIVQHIERLASSGIRHIRIAGSIQQFSVRKRVGDGSEWGVTVRYSDLHGPDLRDECIASSGECLYLNGDEFLAPHFLDALKEPRGAPVAADADQRLPGLYRLTNTGVVAELFANHDGNSELRHQLENASDVLSINMLAADHRINGMVLPGRRVHERAVADWQSTISPTAYIGRSVVVGKHCDVRASARLEKNVILSNGVVVDSGACLENVLVLPNTYVSSALRVRDAIIGHAGIVDTKGRFFDANEHGLVGQTRGFHERTTGLPGRLPSLWGKNATSKV